jgi:hypothetical protein
LEVLSPELAR